MTEKTSHDRGGGSGHGPDAVAEVPRLFEAMVHGLATQAERSRLERLLADPVCRRAYVDAARLHCDLLWRWHRGRKNPLPLAFPTDQRRAAVVSPAPRKAAGWFTSKLVSYSRPVPLKDSPVNGTSATVFRLTDCP